MEPMNRILQEGDIVDVYFGMTECEFGVKVLYTPMDTGDCFHLQRNDGTLVYVMNFDKMIKREV